MPSPLEPVVRDYRRSSFPCSMQDNEHYVRSECLEHIGPHDDYYQCSQHGCDQDFLCIGCVYECDACGDDFCREHILDVERDGELVKRLCVRCYGNDMAAMAQKRVHQETRVAA